MLSLVIELRINLVRMYENGRIFGIVKNFNRIEFSQSFL